MIRGAPAERMTAIRHVVAAGWWAAEAGAAGARMAGTPAEYTYGGIGGTIGGCPKLGRIRTNGGVGPTSPPTPRDLAGLTSPGTHGPTVWIIAWIITRADI